ncbi:MAG: hypothetical protein QGG40_20995, partial [Myxococcota bacterium]|nr:hypothetical protein [Myxococcota bacterium]
DGAPTAPPGLLEAIALEAPALALLEAGLPSKALDKLDLDRTASHLVSTTGSHWALPTHLAAQVRSQHSLQPAHLATRWLHRLSPTLSLAVGDDLPGDAAPPDFITLRWMAEVLPNPHDACRVAAAAAHLLIRWGQATVACDLLETAERRNTRARPGARALLAWAEAHARLELGYGAEGKAAFHEAQRRMKEDTDIALEATLTRRWADALLLRGDARSAARHLQAARTLHRAARDSAGVTAALRGTGDCAVQLGETVSAEALYDQARGGPAPTTEHISLRLGQAGLFLSRGNLARARRLVEVAREEDGEGDILRGNLARREAELALRAEDADAAIAHSREAARRYGRAGLRVSVAQAGRLLADALASKGALADAARTYRKVIEIQVRLRDLTGLARTLEHAALLESEAGDASLADQYEEIARILREATSD